MPITPDIPKAEVAIVELTNAFRATSGLQALKRDPALTTAAQGYARFLAASTAFSHEADGRRPADRIKAAGYQACTSAENLAWVSDSRGFATHDLATQMVEGWKASPPHRKSMELPLVTETGVAIVKTRSEEKYIGVQLFGRPASMQYTFEIENRGSQAVPYSLAGEAMRVEPNMLVRHTLCEPTEITFETKAGGLVSKPTTARFETKGAQVYRLTSGKGGTIAVQIDRK
jgi:hypothetical protein